MKKDRAPRATKKDLYMREVLIMDLIGKNKSRVEICEIMAEKFNISHHTATKQYEKVVRKMQEDLQKERETLAIQLIERNNEIYRRCMAEAKYKTAIDANHLIAKIAGMFREKQESSNDKPKFITVREKDQSKPKLEIAKAEGDE